MKRRRKKTESLNARRRLTIYVGISTTLIRFNKATLSRAPNFLRGTVDDSASLLRMVFTQFVSGIRRAWIVVRRRMEGNGKIITDFIMEISRDAFIVSEAYGTCLCECVGVQKYLWWWIRWDKSKAMLSTLAQDKGSHHRFAAGTAAHTKLLFSRRCVQIKYAHSAYGFFSGDSTLYARQRRTVFICFWLKRLCSMWSQPFRQMPWIHTPK